MKVLIPALLLALGAGAALAQPINENPPRHTIQCIEVSGRQIPAVCQVPASRVDTREFICTCIEGGQRVEVPICAKNERPPPESAAFERARRLAARDGTLVGDTFAGRRICTAPRRP